jgi:hypothetical protein
MKEESLCEGNQRVADVRNRILLRLERYRLRSAALGSVLQSEFELHTSSGTRGRKPFRGKVEAESNKKCKRENKKCWRMCIVF